MVLTIFAEIADFERSLIGERTSTGRAAAKAKGVRFGPKPVLTPEQITHARRLIDEGQSVSEVARLLGGIEPRYTVLCVNRYNGVFVKCLPPEKPAPVSFFCAGWTPVPWDWPTLEVVGGFTRTQPLRLPYKACLLMYVTYLPLQFWNKCWKLDGPWVGCRRCDCVQHFTNPGAFNHALGCPAHRVYGQYPFRELGMIVEQKIQEELF